MVIFFSMKRWYSETLKEFETVGYINKSGYSLLVAISTKLRVLKIGQSYTKLSLDIQLIAK